MDVAKSVLQNLNYVILLRKKNISRVIRNNEEHNESKVYKSEVLIGYESYCK